MKKVHKTLAVLVYWSIAAEAHGSAECIHGDIRQRDEQATATTTAGGVEVCVSGSWTTVCHTGGWHSETLSSTENTRVACRQLGYREEGALFTFATGSDPRSATGLRQSMCSGSELQLIDCPAIGHTAQCVNGVILSCQLVTCSTTIRLRGGSTATGGRVEVCRDGQWGTVCDDSWDRNDASVACRQLGLSDFIAVPVPNDFFGPGSVSIHISNPQCNGNEATLTDCTFNTQHQCSHDQDASVICLTNNNSIIPTPVVIETEECASDNDTIVYNSEQATVTLCQNQQLTTCNNECQVAKGVSQLGAYFCGLGEITHFLMNGSQLYECPISGAREFLICEPTAQTLANNCQQVLQDIELQASSSSITVTWGNVENFNNSLSFADYNISCLVKNCTLHTSIIVDAATSEVTVENLPHSTTYECCVTLHIGRYSTRACGNTATLAATTATACEQPTHTVLPHDSDGSCAIQGAGLWVIIALGVLVAVLVLLLVLVTGAWLYSRRKAATATKCLSDGGPQLSQDPTYALPTSGGIMAAKSGTEAEYEVVDREQQQQPPNGEELKQNPAYSVHKTHPQQTNTAAVYETVDL